MEMLVEAHAAIRADADATLLDREGAIQQQLNAVSLKRAALNAGTTSPPAADLDREISELVAKLRAVRADIRTRTPNSRRS